MYVFHHYYILLLWWPLVGCLDAIAAYQWLVCYLLVESDKKLNEELKNHVRFFKFIAYFTYVRIHL